MSNMASTNVALISLYRLYSLSDSLITIPRVISLVNTFCLKNTTFLVDVFLARHERKLHQNKNVLFLIKKAPDLRRMPDCFFDSVLFLYFLLCKCISCSLQDSNIQYGFYYGKNNRGYCENNTKCKTYTACCKVSNNTEYC